MRVVDATRETQRRSEGVGRRRRGEVSGMHACVNVGVTVHLPAVSSGEVDNSG